MAMSGSDYTARVLSGTHYQSINLLNMKQKLFLAVVVTACIFTFSHVNGQQEKQVKDKFTLLTMPYNQRPLTLYKGQLQVNAGYKFAVRTHSFDNKGDKISLKENGSASILHNYFFDIKYGITNFIEIEAQSNYTRNGIRSETTNYWSGSDQITVNTLNETKGMSDLLIQSTIRLPIEYKWFDFGISGGLSLPAASYKPAQPTHTITDITAANSYTINYQFNNKNGYGVPLYLIGAATKFTYEKISIEASGTLTKPIKEGNSIRWKQKLTGTTFSYYNKPYKYLLSKSLTINTSLHYQAAGWFDIRLNGRYYKSDGGRTEYWGVNYANPDITLFTLEPGFEIQISPSLTIYQVAGFPLSGKSTDAPFYMFTTLSFNMFPFLR
jgi:hypothetical protein